VTPAALRDPTLPPETTTPVLATWTPARGPVLDPRTASKRQRRFKFELALGGFYNWIHAAQAYGGDGLVAMGSSNNRTTWDFNFQYSLGTTLHGLEVRKWRVGFTWDWIFDRSRFGLRQCFGGIELDRATTDGELGTLFIGLDAHASYDVIKISEFSALFLAAAVKVDGGAWGPVIQVGFRGDVLTKALPEVGPRAGASSSTPHRVPPAPASPKR
jgi:hypothetical protein